MRPGQSVSFHQLQSAYADVQRELARAGLWYEGARLTRTEVIWCRVPPPDMWDANGFFINGDHRSYRSFGYAPGHIYIPVRIPDQGRRQDRGSLRDVLRHEFGHALAYHYPSLIRRRRAFVLAFGAGYDADWTYPPGEPYDFVTDYAMTSPMEDFAETFAHWLRDPANPVGRLPRFRRNPYGRPSSVLRAKLRFIKALCRRLTLHHLDRCGLR